MERRHSALVLIRALMFITLFVPFVAIPAYAQEPQMVFPAAVPERVLAAKTISVVVYWPEGSWQDIVNIQADGERFLRNWKRYHVIHRDLLKPQFALFSVLPSYADPDLVVVVLVEPDLGAPVFSLRFSPLCRLPDRHKQRRPNALEMRPQLETAPMRMFPFIANPIALLPFHPAKWSVQTTFSAAPFSCMTDLLFKQIRGFQVRVLGGSPLLSMSYSATTGLLPRDVAEVVTNI